MSTDETLADPDREPFEVRRWSRPDVTVFAAMDNMAQIAERVLAIVGEGRVMNKIATYVHSDGLKDLRGLDHATGLSKGGHAGHPEGHHVWHRDDQAGFSVFLAHGRRGSLEGFGVGVLNYNAATEQQVRSRFETTLHIDRHRDISLVEIHGRPGEPNRSDRIEVMYWNEHGVLRHTIITFVEPDWCDSGRVEETNYLVMGHRKDPDRKGPTRDEEVEVFYSSTDQETAREARKTFADSPTTDFVWLAEEKVTRERRSI